MGTFDYKANVAAMDVGTVFQALFNPNPEKCLALDGCDYNVGDYPELVYDKTGARRFPGVFTSTARTLAVAPVAAVIDADSTNYLAMGADGTGPLQHSTDGLTGNWTNSTTWTAATGWRSLVKAGTRWVIAGANSGDSIVPYVSTLNQAAASTKASWSATTGAQGTTLTQGLAYAPFVASITAGSFVSGVQYKITSIGSTDFTLIGAASNTVGLIFTATGVGAGTGTALTGRTVLVKNGSLATASGIFYLNDGSTTWVAAAGGSTADRTAVCWTGQKFITTAGSNLIQTSPDGATWTDQYALPESWVSSGYGMASDGNGTVVITGTCPVDSTTFVGALVSKNHGVTWKKVQMQIGSADNASPMLAPQYVNGKFIVSLGTSSYASHLISSDGLTWFYEPTGRRGMATITATTFVGIAYKSGVYCFIKAASTSAYTSTEDASKFRLTDINTSVSTGSGAGHWNNPALGFTPAFIKARS